MKKVGELMQEMGFRPEASESVKEAFLKNLIKGATGVEVETPSQNRKRTQEWTSLKSDSKEPQQLSFDFDQNASKKRVG